jgi:uncharacterized SAM-dependent methyltransferase
MQEQINDLIFKELIKRGYSLEGKTRVWNIADSKLWYLTPLQAQAYLDLVSTEEYKKGIGPKELTLIHKYKSKIIESIGDKPINIVDLGCGNGKKGAIIIEESKLVGIKKIRYCPIDISGYMVEHAIEEVSKLKFVDEILKVQWNISDFENLENITPLLRRDDYKTNFFLLLGNTLGNFEIHELLYEVRSAMREGDVLLIGNGLNNNNVENDIVKSCKENPAFNKFFGYILSEIGFVEEDAKFDVRFNNSRVEFVYTILKDKSIEFQGKSINFYAGDQIMVAYTYHYEKDEFISYLKMYFDYVQLYYLDDDSYALAVCMK